MSTPSEKYSDAAVFFGVLAAIAVSIAIISASARPVAAWIAAGAALISLGLGSIDRPMHGG